MLIRHLLLILGSLLLAPQRSQGQQDPQFAERVNRAVGRAVPILKRIELERSEPVVRYEAGQCALYGWALLEAGVSASDPAIQKLAGKVRDGVLAEAAVYSHTVAIAFLEKLGEPEDFRLLALLARGLYLAQSERGTWGYRVKACDAADFRRFFEEAKHPLLVPAQKLQDCKVTAEFNRQMISKRDRDVAFRTVAGDHSNTQFALLGLWIARRHGIQVSDAIQSTADHFRRAQDAKSGGWGYVPGSQNSLGMTSAGILSLAMSHLDRKDGSLKIAWKDPAIAAGLRAIAVHGQRNGYVWDGNEHHLFYNLFAIERTLTLLEAKKINDSDWYVDGAQYLLRMQAPEGHWRNHVPGFGDANTAMAVLFLRRAGSSLIGTRLDPAPTPGAVPMRPRLIPLDLPLIIPKKEKS